MVEALNTASVESSVCRTSRVSAAHAVWVVAARELADQLTSLRFLIIALLAIGLAPLAVYVGTRDYTNRLAEYDRLQTEKQGREWQGGATEIGAQENILLLRALRRPEPLSVLVRGLDAAMPAYWDFSAAGVSSGPSASRPRRLGDVLGQLDLEFLVRVVLGLLAILLAFDAVAGEKELGTLRAVLSQSISRAAFLAGKLAGGSITLLVPLAVACLVALLSATFLGLNVLAGGSMVKVLFLAAASAAYLVSFYALGLLISCLTKAQKTALIVLLVTWVFAVLALPPLATLAAQAIVPAAPSYSVEAQKAAVSQQTYREASQEMGAIYSKIAGEGAFNDPRAYREHKQAIDAAVAPVLARFTRKRRNLVDNLERDWERQEERQKKVASTLMTLSPAAAFADAAAELSGTGDAQHRAWVGAVRRQQSALNSKLFDDPVFLTFLSPSGSAELSFSRRDRSVVSQLPVFVPPRRDALAALQRALPALGLLILYSGAFVIGSFVAFSRYDVR